MFVKIRCYADLVFSKYESDWDKIKLFCTPKVLRFAEILKKFQPVEQLKNINESVTRMMNDIEKCDFAALGNKIEDKVNTYEANLKEIEDFTNKKDSDGNRVDSAEIKCDSTSNRSDSAKNKGDSAGNIVESAEIKVDSGQKSFGFSRRAGGRARGRGRAHRSNTARVQQMQQNPDALCGIVFMKEALMAKIMFMLIVVSGFKVHFSLYLAL